MNDPLIFISGLLVLNFVVLGIYDHLKSILVKKQNSMDIDKTEDEHLYNHGVANFTPTRISEEKMYKSLMYK
ncbi:MAG: hypothetical protein KDD40_08445 [Bdellovibrionales bacterium]|nr:hypothetical protein [Bdellovibrionales bacterium]